VTGSQTCALPISSCEWLAALNHLYSELGMAMIRFIDSDSIPLMDRLAAETVDPVRGPKISVIMPTFAPSSGIRTAIRSLLEQSWQNLEIIIVDDASPGRYHKLFKEIEQDRKSTRLNSSHVSISYAVF